MYKILIGLIVVAAVAFLAIRMMPRSKQPAGEVSAPTQREAMAPQDSARQAETDDSRFREWGRMPSKMGISNLDRTSHHFDMPKESSLGFRQRFAVPMFFQL